MSSLHATSRYPEAGERNSQSKSPIAYSRAVSEFLFHPVTRRVSKGERLLESCPASAPSAERPANVTRSYCSALLTLRVTGEAMPRNQVVQTTPNPP